jgi:Carboxypeptidase regulatory-like domain/TonB-dependent Receptor Plug Domain
MSPANRYLTLLAIAAAVSAGSSGSLRAQSASHSREAGSITGVVVDASSRAPLAAVLVTLDPAPGGLIGWGGSHSGLATARSMETNTAGAYRFREVVPGRYRLRVERLGYRAAVLDVEVRRPMDARVSVGLDLEPVPLEPVLVRDQAVPSFLRSAAGAPEPDAARLAIERERQTDLVTADARALTYADVIDGVTLGETDVFRALQRFPGVATRDDYTAELWTRGAPWSQTRVTFDGLPLFNPVHAVGVFSGVAPEILGAVFFQPGYRSASRGEGAAGAVDMRSRPGGGHGELRGALDVSMASARVEMDQRLGDRASWIVSARRSWLDILNGGLDWLGLARADLPYEFHDLAGRFDTRLDDRRTLEISGILEDDRLFGDIEGVLEGTTANWGNGAGQATLETPFGPLIARHTLGFSRYRSHVQESGDSTNDGRPIPWVEPPADNRVLYVRLGTELQPQAVTGRPAGWGAGYEVVVQQTHYDGPEPRYHPVRPDTTIRIHRDGRQWNAGAWVETRLRLGRMTVVPGLRAEAGSRIADYETVAPADPVTRASLRPSSEQSVRLAPRLAAKLEVTPELTVSASVSRFWQYLQAIALAGPSAHPLFHASQFWLLSGEDAPAIRSDVITLGVEQWLGSGWLASASGYARWERGLAMPDPRPGLLEGRPLFVVGRNDARGLELGVRRVAGRVTASLGYTRGESNIEAAGLRFAASTDRRERIDATAALRVMTGLRLGAAWTSMSGAPYTRVTGRIRQADCDLFGFGCTQYAPRVEAPNTRRTPAYNGLDAIATLSRHVGRTETSVYLQLRNVLGHDNAITYTGSIYELRRVTGSTNPDVVWVDRFEQGLPRLPLIGARITF